MKSLRAFIVVFLILIALVLLVAYRVDAGIFLRNSRNFLASFFDRSFQYAALRDLRAENQALKDELGILKNSGVAVRDGRLEAFVYSAYPFNDSGTFIVNVGSRDGVGAGMPVVAASGVLIGQISAVKSTQSEVRTIFDPSWRSSVAIGEGRVKAVLRGGNAPVLEFVPKEAEIGAGDAVLNTAPEYPLNLSLGRVTDLKITPQDPWFSAGLGTAYSLTDIQKVLILVNFP